MTAILQMYLRSAKFSKNTNYGFTLIELLVVIIIIGILSAIALPSFLNQAARARQSEANVYVSSMLKGQQVYYLENMAFTPILENLDVGTNFNASTNYRYGTAPLGAIDTGIMVTATPISPSLAGSVGKVELSNTSTISLQCNLDFSRQRGAAAVGALIGQMAEATVCPPILSAPPN